MFPLVICQPLPRGTRPPAGLPRARDLPALGLGPVATRLWASVSSPGKNHSAPGRAGSSPEPSRQGAGRVFWLLGDTWLVGEKQSLIAQNPAASAQRSG